MAKKTKKRYDDGGEIVVTGTRPGSNTNPMGALPVSYALPPVSTTTRQLSAFGAPAGSSGSSSSRGGISLGKFPTNMGNLYGGSIPITDRSRITFGATKAPGSLGIGGAGVSYSTTFKKGGAVKAKKIAKGGTASKRGDGCAQRGKTKGKMV